MKTNTTRLAALSFVAALSFSALQTAHAQCRDPWINNAYRDVAKRSPVGRGEVGECNIKLYNNGSWNNYDELKRYVQELRSSGTKVGYGDAGNGRFGMAVKGNGITVINLMDASGNIVAAGAGNIVAAGAGNLIGMGGNTLIGADGGTFTINQSTPGFAFSGSYATISGQRIRTSGRGGLKVQ